MFVTRDKAHRLFVNGGRKFVDEFVLCKKGSVRLRSKEPAAAWNANGKLGYLSVVPWQPYHVRVHAGRGPAPLLVRVQFCMRPPPAVPYAVRSKAFRSQLGLRSEAVLLADVPKLELVCTVEQLDRFAEWLAAWERAHVGLELSAPKPPYGLYGPEASYDFVGGNDGRWLHYQDLWTDDAEGVAREWFGRQAA